MSKGYPLTVCVLFAELLRHRLFSQVGPGFPPPPGKGGRVGKTKSHTDEPLAKMASDVKHISTKSEHAKSLEITAQEKFTS